MSRSLYWSAARSVPPQYELLFVPGVPTVGLLAELKRMFQSAVSSVDGALLVLPSSARVVPA